MNSHAIGDERIHEEINLSKSHETVFFFIWHLWVAVGLRRVFARGKYTGR